MDYVNNFLETYYKDDIDYSIYSLFIRYVFQEISNRMNTEKDIEGIINAYQIIGVNENINVLINSMINFVKLENLSKAIRENLNHEPIILIFEDYANKFCNINRFPKKEINLDELNITR